MTIPTIFSNAASSQFTNIRDIHSGAGIPVYVRFSVTIPSGTAGNTDFALANIPVGGCPVAMFIANATDADSGTAITVDVGVRYNQAGTTGEVVDTYFDGINILQAANRSVIWPTLDAAVGSITVPVYANPGWVTLRVLDSGVGGTTAATVVSGFVTFIQE